MPGVELATGYVNLTVSGRGITSDIQRELGGGLTKTAEESSSKIGGLLRGAATVAAGGFAALKGIDFARGLIDQAEESRRVAAQTASVIQSTGGAAHVSAQQFGELATAISNKTGIDDEAIQSGENLLATFTNIKNGVGKGNDVFNQATSSITDMSVALGQDMKSSAIQVGKALNDPIKGVTALQRVGVSFCLTEDAEALTRDRGWVQHDDLSPGDLILSYDTETDEILWEPIQSVHRFGGQHDMIRWRNNNIDVLSTPHHRWWTVEHDNRSRYQPQIRTTEEISGDRVYVKIGGGQSACFAPEPTYDDDLVELIGWVVTEGWYHKQRPALGAETGTRQLRTVLDESRMAAIAADRRCGLCGGLARAMTGPARCDDCLRNARGPWVGRGGDHRGQGQCGIGFSQSQTHNPKHVARIRDLVDRLVDAGHAISETQYQAQRNGSIISEWFFAHELGATVRRVAPGKKLTPAFLSALTREQAELLLDVLIAADGTVDRKGRRVFIQKDPGQLDMFEMLCSMLGLRSGRAGRTMSSAILQNNRLYGAAVNPTRETYEGVVWCPHLRTGMWFARVNGRTFWTGNTADQKKQIETMVKSGDTMGAQRLILGELNKEFGGSAAAQATAGKKLSVVWGNIQEQLGGALLPIVDKVATFLAAKLPVAMAAAQRAFAGLKQLLGSFMGDFKGGGPFQEDSPWIGGALKVGQIFRDKILPVIKEVAAWIKDHLTVVLVALGAAIVLIVAGPIALIVAALVAAYLKFKVFREVVDAVVRFFVDVVAPAISKAVGWISDQFDHFAAFVKVIWPSIQEAIGHVINFIRDIINGFIAVIGAAWRLWGDDILRVVKGIWGIVLTEIRFVINTVKDVIKIALDLINGDWGKAWHALLDLLKGIWDGIVGILKGSWDIINGIFGGAFDAIGRIVKTGLRLIIDAFLEMVGFVVGGAAKAFGWIPGIGDKLRDAKKAIDGFKDDVNRALGDIHDKDVLITFHGVANVQGQRGTPVMAAGGVVTKPTLALIGEAGPEAVIPLSQLSNAPAGAAYQPGAGGNVYNLTVHAGMGADGYKLGQEIVRQIQSFERVTGSEWRQR